MTRVATAHARAGLVPSFALGAVRDGADRSNVVVWAALIGNLGVAAIKLVAAVVTQSAAMASEGVHSLVDTTNEVLLLYGLHRSRRPPDASYPFGYGREVYFWSFVVALLVLTVGAGAAVYQGVSQWIAPRPLDDPHVSYAVLALSAVFEGVSWVVSIREFRRRAGSLDAWTAFRQSKDPPTFMVLLEDSAALVGLALAAIGTWLATRFDEPRFDAAASLAIAVVLALVAVMLAARTKSLLIGERASPRLTEAVLAQIRAFDGVETANGVLAMQLAPDLVIAIVSVAFDDRMTAPEIETLVETIEKAVLDEHPELGRLFVKPQTPTAFDAAIRDRFGDRVGASG